MTGRQSRQMSMIFVDVDIESLIPGNHLLRKSGRMVSNRYMLSTHIL